MSLLAAAVVTESSVTIERVPIEFLEIETATLETMGMTCEVTRRDTSPANRHPPRRPDDDPGSPQGTGRQGSHPMPFPGLQYRQPPVLALIAAKAEGNDDDPRLGHGKEPGDLSLPELTKVGVRMQLLDPHR